MDKSGRLIVAGGVDVERCRCQARTNTPSTDVCPFIRRGCALPPLCLAVSLQIHSTIFAEFPVAAPNCNPQSKRSPTPYCTPLVGPPMFLARFLSPDTDKRSFKRLFGSSIPPNSENNADRAHEFTLTQWSLIPQPIRMTSSRSHTLWRI